jgi:TctA family transporter
MLCYRNVFIKLTGLSEVIENVSLTREFIIVLLGLAGVVLVSNKSEEPFTHTFIKLIAQSLEWLFLLLTLVAFTSLIDEKNTTFGLFSFLGFALITYGIHKLKFSSRLNNT